MQGIDFDPVKPAPSWFDEHTTLIVTGVVVFFLLAVGGLFYAQKDDYGSKRSRTGWSVLFGGMMTVVVVYAGAVVSIFVTSDHETDAMKQNTDTLREKLVAVWPEVGQATERGSGTVYDVRVPVPLPRGAFDEKGAAEFETLDGQRCTLTTRSVDIAAGRWSGDLECRPRK